jgi:hypothetical protein
MGEGLQLARLGAFIEKKGAARWHGRRVTIGAVGRTNGEPWVMGRLANGSVVLGAPSDFSVPQKRVRKTKS